ncbi:MAG: hypothetical protein IT445_17105 [Phycisphaeraceae bacterium]|nr:hypothetical protein [Phycisphaeraceae bacterium]
MACHIPEDLVTWLKLPGVSADGLYPSRYVRAESRVLGLEQSTGHHANQEYVGGQIMPSAICSTIHLRSVIAPSIAQTN